ncbi:MAG TPA: efflux RND transporter periplasmic adaptor subunit, partial [Flavitalea sp.]|nr:efflux RND transporter periplasmic adaptor subunit [Flavitalea sp.]
MKRITLILFGFSLIGISCKTDTKESDALYAGEVIPVKVAGIRFGETSNEVVATGLLTTENEARLSFKIGGVIDRILVNEGEFIRKGQLLATLKTAEINSQLEQARLGFIKAKRDYDRATNLYNDSVATLEQLQNAKTALDIAEQAVDQVSFNNKFASIVAPADGFVTKKNSNAGEVVGPGAPVLAISESNSQSNWLLKVGVSDKD